MTDKYNLLPGARHFMAYFAGPDIRLHFSYTSSRMYCKHSVHVEDEVFEYVEARRLDDDSESDLDAMAADDYIGAASYFSRLLCDGQTNVELEEGFDELRSARRGLKRLWQELEGLEADSDEYLHVDALRDMLLEETSDVRSKVERILSTFNQDSGYDPQEGTIRRAVR